MLSETGFIINHWITVIWLIAAAAYSIFAIYHDIANARKAKQAKQAE